VRKRFPNSHITVITQPYVKEIVKGNPDIDEIITYDHKTQKGIGESLKLIWLFRKRKFNLVIIFNPQKKFNVITFLARIPIRIGYNRKWGFLLTDKIEDKKYLGEKHEVEYNLDLVKLIAANCKQQIVSYGLKDKSLFIPVKQDDEEFVKKRLRENNISKQEILFAIHPFTSNPQKQWQIEKFIELARRISQWQKARVIIIGGKEEQKVGQQYFAEGNEAIIDFSGKFSLKQTAALLKKCKVLISCDSGPVHLASAMGTPIVAIFRNAISGTSAKRWGPWRVKHIVVENKELDRILVDEVEKAIGQIL